MKKFILAVISFCIVGFLAGSLLLFSSSEEVLVRSLESKTKDGNPVYNKIKWLRRGERDIWMMNQSHQGLNSQSWDRLAIIVENNKATFLQLPAGKLEWSDDLLQKQLANKVSCFICHANGPRAIRPEDTPAVEISISDRFKILLLNLRIKSYGRIEENSFHKIQDIGLVTPFRHRGVKDNERLMVKTCLKCHSNEGLMARGYLTRQNSITIDFMINNKLMPPLGIGLSAIEKRQVRDFIEGF